MSADRTDLASALLLLEQALAESSSQAEQYRHRAEAAEALARSLGQQLTVSLRERDRALKRIACERCGAREGEIRGRRVVVVQVHGKCGWCE
jgi:hypothetical protein